MGLKDTAALFEVIRPRQQVKAYTTAIRIPGKSSQDDTDSNLINLLRWPTSFTTAILPVGRHDSWRME